MHASEIVIPPEAAAGLVAAQFPQFADLPLAPVAEHGSDNVLFRLGDELSLRFPRRAEAVAQVARDHRWLRVMTDLPLNVPQPVAIGAPGQGFPWPWAVHRWIDGSRAMPGAFSATPVAAQLAEFLRALQAVPTEDAPRAGAENHFRGVALKQRDAATRGAIAGIADLFNPAQLTRMWQDGLSAPCWDHPPVWIHGDLQPGNLLIRDGRLVAVIDWGLSAVGDPAADLTVAWSLLDGEGRAAFLDTLRPDPDTFLRGRAWAVYAGAIALSYYRDRDAGLTAYATRILTELTEH
ncbi:hypothetical protein ACMU_02435 [Actibacterium mucosum KCTC 23349]|uniref:Aminoglycoside phosphotransferase domain-containing protein n=1 Tax=Actibacterium mucosum KCTC 23349 TaxID=1454373 RepID=A0A037ZNZ3_9RHOB|nr:aminoglycoside phosphotransferase family protein [Actibacterium mucosum]KAJ57380.1 hypothetical protein ACMU_02435 [Actibacterium mucosum KCTC 23349]